MPNNPDFLQNIIGYAAEILPINATSLPGTGALSYQSGWPAITSVPLESGGIAPQREYFNAINKLFSEHLFFLQSGCVYPWSASLDYQILSQIKGSDGRGYIAAKESGPGTTRGPVNPVGDKTGVWIYVVDYYKTSVSSIIQPGGGLIIDANGQILVDFSSMPTDKFDAIIEDFRKSLRLPKWLTAHTNFYVNKNYVEASDILDEERGLSPNKPFKNIQPCINYIADNYNLNKFNAIINIANGTYYNGNRNEALTIGGYQSSTGILTLQGQSRTGVICPPISIRSAGKTVALKSLAIGSYPNVAVQDGSLEVVNSVLKLYDVMFDNSFMADEFSGLYNFLVAEEGSVVTVETANDPLVGLYFKNGATSKSPNYCLNIKSRSQLTILADLNFLSDFDFNIVARAEAYANIREAYRSWYQYPAQAPVCKVSSGKTVTGQRFHGYTFSSIGNTYGNEWFPGSTAGSVDSSSVIG